VVAVESEQALSWLLIAVPDRTCLYSKKHPELLTHHISNPRSEIHRISYDLKFSSPLHHLHDLHQHAPNPYAAHASRTSDQRSAIVYLTRSAVPPACSVRRATANDAITSDHVSAWQRAVEEDRRHFKRGIVSMFKYCFAPLDIIISRTIATYTTACHSTLAVLLIPPTKNLILKPAALEAQNGYPSLNRDTRPGYFGASADQLSERRLGSKQIGDRDEAERHQT
jgi:hypothetical protein